MRSSRKSDILPSSDEDDQNEDSLSNGDPKIMEAKVSHLTTIPP
jgi:hypothetical protein